MMKFDQQLNSCGFNPDNLDDWLENDLKQSGILPSDTCDRYVDIKLEDPIDWERHSCSDGSDDKTVVDDVEFDTGNNTNKKHIINTPLPTQLGPILKALAVLTSLQQQGTALPGLLPVTPSLFTLPPPPTATTSSHLIIPDVINPMHVTMTPGNIQTHIATAPLPPINHTSTKRQRDEGTVSDRIESLDPLALKRRKNTDAARRSRQRKVMKMETLASRVEELEQHNEQLLLQVTVAENERDIAKVKESTQRKKVAALEAELAKSHQALLQQGQEKNTDN